MKLKKVLACLACAAFSFGALTLHAEVVDKVLVVVNDEVVTQREFDRVYLPIKRNFESRFQGEELDTRLEKVQADLLKQLVDAKLTVSLAKKEKVGIDEAELKARVDKVKSFYASEAEFLQALSDKGTNLTEFERELREQMLAQALVQKDVSSAIVIPPAEIKDLYEKNKERLVSPPAVKLRGIMVRKKEDSKRGEDEKKMKKIVADLNKGKDFSAMAVEFSEGPYAQKGGDMGYVAPGQLLEEIDGVVFTLKKGERSGIVETRIGYHVFLVEDVQKPRQLEFNEVSDFLRQQLYMKKFEEELTKWLEEKRKNAYISYK